MILTLIGAITVRATAQRAPAMRWTVVASFMFLTLETILARTTAVTRISESTVGHW